VGNTSGNEIITFHNLPQRIPRNKENTQGVTRDSANIRRKYTWESGIGMSPVGRAPGGMRGLSNKNRSKGGHQESKYRAVRFEWELADARKPQTGEQSPFVVAERGWMDLLCRRVVALSGEKKVQLASAQRKASKLSRMYSGDNLGAYESARGTAPVGTTSVGGKSLTCVKSNRPGPSLQQKQKAQK